MTRRQVEHPDAKRRTMKISDPTYHWIRIKCVKENRLIADFIEFTMDLMRRCDEVGIDPFALLEGMIREVKEKKRKKRVASSSS